MIQSCRIIVNALYPWDGDSTIFFRFPMGINVVTWTINSKSGFLVHSAAKLIVPADNPTIEGTRDHTCHPLRVQFPGGYVTHEMLLISFGW
jgi:hypothetical protein